MDTIKPNFNAIVFAINIDEPPHKWCITECSLAQLLMHHAVDIDTPAGKMPEFFARGNAIWRPSMHGATKIKVFDTENEADYAALMLHFDQMSYTYCMYEPFYYESKAEAAAFIAAKQSEVLRLVTQSEAEQARYLSLNCAGCFDEMELNDLEYIVKSFETQKSIYKSSLENLANLAKFAEMTSRYRH